VTLADIHTTTAIKAFDFSLPCPPTMAEPNEKHVSDSSVPTTEPSERDEALIDSGNSDKSDAQVYASGIALVIVLIADLLAVFLVATTNFAP
jgi:hypothetical protein